MMKKILLILALFISVTTYSQGVKISAMPQWTNSLDSVWFPIIYNNGTNWINYRAQGWQLAKERLDSLVLALDSKVDNSTTITINGVTYDLSDNRSWTIASGTAVAANNGLVISSGTADTVQLGSSTAGPAVLLTNRFIDFSSKYLSLTGTVADGFGLLRVANTNSNWAITATTAGDAIGGSSTGGGTGISGNTTTGSGVAGAASTGGWGGDFSTTSTTTNTLRTIVLLSRNTSGTAATGMGGSIDFSMSKASGGGSTTVKIGAVWADPLAVSYTSNIEFWSSRSTAMTKQVVIKGSGNLWVVGTGKAVALTSPDGTVYYGVISNAGVLSWSTTEP